MNVPDAALAWYDAGACVLPVATDGSKQPTVKWKQYQQERPSREQVATWTRDAPGMGMLCGHVSGNVEMFELEAAAVDEGMHLELRRMFEEAGYTKLWTKLQTYVERSPAGGIHWIFAVEGGRVAGNTKLATRPDPQPDDPHFVRTLIETRGEGGFTILAPSGGPVHPSGGSWTILSGRPGQVPMLTADEVETLHRLARSFSEMPELPEPVRPAVPLERRPGELTPGDDYNQRTDWADLLEPAGWKHVATRGGVRHWRRPGKNSGISATTGYGDGYDLLYVFSSSTTFQSERSYDKLGAYAVLHHGGSIPTAASALRKQGYGSPPPPRNNLLQSVPAGPSATDETTTPPGDPPPGGDTQADVPPSWDEIDLTTYLDGTHVPQVPELLARSDGKFLLYAGRVHSFHGESESGKSWAALHAAAEAMQQGKRVVMIDFESDAGTVVTRLLLLGVPADTIRELFSYRRPEVHPGTLAREYAAWEQMLTGRYTIAIIDGVTEALSVFSVTSKDNDEVTKWIRTIPRRIAASTGAAVILVDHVTKDADTRGRFAIGGQAKMAALDGAAYVVEVIEPLGVGLVGRISLRVAKDRPGGVRPISGAWRKTDRTQETAVIVVDSTIKGETSVRIEMPRSETQDTPADDRQPWRPTGYMERVSKVLENANDPMSRNAINLALQARRDYVMQAVDFLIEDGYAAADGPVAYRSNTPTVRLIKPYREPGTRSAPKTGSERCSDVVPGSRSNDRGNQGTTSSPGTRFPETMSELPGNYDDPDLFDE